MGDDLGDLIRTAQRLKRAAKSLGIDDAIKDGVDNKSERKEFEKLVKHADGQEIGNYVEKHRDLTPAQLEKLYDALEGAEKGPKRDYGMNAVVSLISRKKDNLDRTEVLDRELDRLASEGNPKTLAHFMETHRNDITPAELQAAAYLSAQRDGPEEERQKAMDAITKEMKERNITPPNILTTDPVTNEVRLDEKIMPHSLQDKMMNEARHEAIVKELGKLANGTDVESVKGFLAEFKKELTLHDLEPILDAASKSGMDNKQHLEVVRALSAENLSRKAAGELGPHETPDGTVTVPNQPERLHNDDALNTVLVNHQGPNRTPVVETHKVDASVEHKEEKKVEVKDEPKVEAKPEITENGTALLTEKYKELSKDGLTTAERKELFNYDLGGKGASISLEEYKNPQGVTVMDAFVTDDKGKKTYIDGIGQEETFKLEAERKKAEAEALKKPETVTTIPKPENLDLGDGNVLVVDKNPLKVNGVVLNKNELSGGDTKGNGSSFLKEQVNGTGFVSNGTTSVEEPKKRADGRTDMNVIITKDDKGVDHVTINGKEVNAKAALDEIVKNNKSNAYHIKDENGHNMSYADMAKELKEEVKLGELSAPTFAKAGGNNTSKGASR